LECQEIKCAREVNYEIWWPTDIHTKPTYYILTLWQSKHAFIFLHYVILKFCLPKCICSAGGCDLHCHLMRVRFFCVFPGGCHHGAGHLSHQDRLRGVSRRQQRPNHANIQNVDPIPPKLFAVSPI